MTKRKILSLSTSSWPIFHVDHIHFTKSDMMWPVLLSRLLWKCPESNCSALWAVDSKVPTASSSLHSLLSGSSQMRASEYFSNEIRLWSPETWNNCEHLGGHLDTMSIGQKMRSQERETRIWSKGWLWDELEVSHCSLLCRPSEGPVSTCALIFYNLPQRPWLRWEWSKNKR